MTSFSSRAASVRVVVAILILVAAVPGGLLANGIYFPQNSCGPSASWVNGCPAGYDIFASTANVTVEILSPHMTMSASLMDPATVIYRGLGGNPTPGTILTEMVALNLFGGGLLVRAGDGIGNLVSDGPLYSGGQVKEQPGDPHYADSFFDVFFEVVIPGMPSPVHNTDAVRMQSVIDRVPPLDGTVYIPPPDTRIPLYDQAGNLVGYLTHAEHVIGPEPSSLLLLGAGLAGILIARKRIARRLGGRR